MSSGTSSTPTSKALAKLFCYILMHWPVGVNSAFIAGKDNDLADILSRTLDHTHYTHDSLFACALPPLQIQIPQIRGWQCFLPSPELLKLLHSALSIGSVSLPTTKIPLGQLMPTSIIGSDTVLPIM